MICEASSTSAAPAICTNRFDEHYWLTDNDLLSLAMRQPFGELTFSWVIAEDESERANLENQLIAWFRPACNLLLPSNH